VLIALVLAGLVAGATGSWSPCGFSMIDTLGAGSRRSVAGACAAFALGAPVGGAVTFGGLALLGSLLQGGGRALAVAAAIALTAALLEAAGVRVVPQIRRQVPESWRRVLPLPVAGFLYGVLLGMGFTTYVLSFAVPALAGVSTALGDPALGLALGAAFGVGRALPIVALAPFARADLGARAITLMAERPGLLRGARAADAVALAACALVFAPAAARGATFVAADATDPSVAGGALAWQVPGGPGRLLLPGAAAQDLAGAHPALGAGALAYTTAEGIAVRAADGSQRSVGAPGADAIAVGTRWLVWRMPAPDRLDALDLSDPSAVPRTLERVPAPATISRPALDGDLLAYAVAGRRGSTIRLRNLASGGKPTVLRSGARVLLDNPALAAGALLYVRASARHQELLLGPASPGGRDRTLLRYRFTTGRDAGHQAGYSHQGRLPEDKLPRPLKPSKYVLWTTALSDRAAYVTRLLRAGGAPDLVRVKR
jgi:cytochrome c biogenesis protein CcdA